ncbi:MAG: alpha/beta hydrolase [Opitutae bacterium]|nr:alpha/beta hydrolase [Opitutae bacterium]
MKTPLYLALALSCLLGVSGCGRSDRAESPARPIGKRLAFGEHEIYYEVHGQSSRTLVFIHGWTGNLQVWKNQSDAFPGYRCIGIDLPGNGQSSRREGVPYTMELFADSVRAVLDAEKIDQAFFFGHSMGFAVTEVFAAKYPQRCLGIAAIDGAHFEVAAGPGGPEKFQQENAAFAAGMTNEAAREGFIRMLFLPDTPAALQEEILQASRTVPLSIGQAMIAGVGTDWKFFLPRTVDLPCLAVYSPAYQLSPTYRDDFARIFPQVEYHEVPDVSHFYMLEIPDRLNQLIADFIARH